MINDEANIRRDYAQGILSRDTLSEQPLEQFEIWLQQAIADNEADATAMSLATVNADGHPSVRIVLLKGHGERGFVWYTSYASHKGQDLDVNPNAALMFYWRESERQVRITGTVSKLTTDQSERYFRTRPRESQLSALASQQSQEIADRSALEARVEALSAQYNNTDVPVPDNWGGYILSPIRYEFWQGRVGRLHDRFSYEKQDNRWLIKRLQP
ncbi:MAG: pyridoxamine 5'-phosphate oxidase [Pseudomonadales bacterium]|nr:pyridoxamine 5'-phosphate oxidase [Pseudomonadales bacterium]